MPSRKQLDDPNTELQNLLKKTLILRLFELRVPQGAIARKVKVDVHFVNEFLKGIKRANAKAKETEE